MSIAFSGVAGNTVTEFVDCVASQFMLCWIAGQKVGRFREVERARCENYTGVKHCRLRLFFFLSFIYKDGWLCHTFFLIYFYCVKTNKKKRRRRQYFKHCMFENVHREERRLFYKSSWLAPVPSKRRREEVGVNKSLRYTTPSVQYYTALTMIRSDVNVLVPLDV